MQLTVARSVDVQLPPKGGNFAVVRVWLLATHDRYVRHNCMISWPGKHFARPAEWGHNDVRCLRPRSSGSETSPWPVPWRSSGPCTAGTARNGPACGSRSLNPKPKSRAAPAPRPGSGITSLRLSSAPAGQSPKPLRVRGALVDGPCRADRSRLAHPAGRGPVQPADAGHRCTPDPVHAVVP